MKSRFVLVQAVNSGDPSENLKKAEYYIEKAYAEYYPDVIVFPELFMTNYPPETDIDTVLASTETLEGPFVTTLRKLAKQYGMWIISGMSEPADDPEDKRKTNTTVMIDSDGKIVSVYRKTHMYNAFGFRESDTMLEGDSLFEPVDTPFGKIGLFVCYEVRFPEIARYLRSKGAEILIMPTAWAEGRIKSHQFHTLINARAIENGCYVVACDLCSPGYLGESVVVDPMGINVSCAGEGEQLLFAEIDTERIEEVRKKVPSFDQRRPELY